jgi:hypothetical protein
MIIAVMFPYPSKKKALPQDLRRGKKPGVGSRATTILLQGVSLFLPALHISNIAKNPLMSISFPRSCKNFAHQALFA